MITLKPRQQEAKECVLNNLENGINTQLIAFPTGTGKTVLACDISKSFNKTLFLIHRKELFEQTANTIQKINPDTSIGKIVSGKSSITPFTIRHDPNCPQPSRQVQSRYL